MSINQDNLYASPIASIRSFKFDESVVNFFPDMIQCSVPGNSAIVSTISLLIGGILILSEKLRFEGARQQVLQKDLHYTFKKSLSYSDQKISQKCSALENVLLTETFSTHQQRLINAGFSSAEVWFLYFNVASMIALK